MQKKKSLKKRSTSRGQRSYVIIVSARVHGLKADFVKKLYGEKSGEEVQLFEKQNSIRGRAKENDLEEEKGRGKEDILDRDAGKPRSSIP